MTDQLLKVLAPTEVPNMRNQALDADALTTAQRMIHDIDTRGDAAVLDYATRFGDIESSRSPESILFGKTEFEAAMNRLPVDQLNLLQRTGQRIRAFAEMQRGCISDLDTTVNGGRAGHTLIPVESVGCYAPGGRFPLVSSLLMCAIPARVAGVRNVWVATPKPSDVMLAAAGCAGSDGLLGIGGVPAIAALARGLVGAARCDVVVGPGNRWVTAAKFLLSAEVGIDMLAGPSELLVLADDVGDAAIIAADLLAQAEHDADALPMLISTDRALIDAVESHLASQVESLPNATIARRALSNGFAVLAGDVDEAIALCNRLAPEHLELMVRDAAKVAVQIRNAGAVFIGSRSAEVFGDFGAGPNHVLPTGGTARCRAGLSVFSFLRARTWLAMDDSTLCDDIEALAGLEQLEGHRRAASMRQDAPLD